MKGHFLFEDPASKRVVFVLDYFDKTLIGTTEEEPDSLAEKVEATQSEIAYLLSIYNRYFENRLSVEDVEEVFSGLRPILTKSNVQSSLEKLSKASREAALEWDDRVLTIYGGKWTSAPSLSRRVASNIKLKAKGLGLTR